MSASFVVDRNKASNDNNSLAKNVIYKTRKSTGLKGIDQLIARYSITLENLETQTIDNPFQNTKTLFGQDSRLEFMNLPYCMYMILSDASQDERFVLHRFYLPHKNGVRFATYLLNHDGEVIESVCYQRNAKYTTAFKVIRAEIKAFYHTHIDLAA